MPAPLNVDREAARVLCVAVGVREAARQMGIPQPTMQAWSARGKWTEKIEAAQHIKANRIISTSTALQPIATKPADALATSLADASKETRFNLAKAAQRAAKSFSKRSGEAVIKSSKALRDVVAASSQLHGWEDKGSQGVTLNLGIAFNNMQ